MLLDEEHPYYCKTHKCLTNEKEIEVTALGITSTITKDDYEHFFNAVQESNVRQGGNFLPEWIIIEMCDMCPRFLFSDTLYNTITYFNYCDGLHVKSPEELDEQLGLWIDACSIIGAEQTKWHAVRQQQEQERKANGK